MSTFWVSPARHLFHSTSPHSLEFDWMSTSVYQLCSFQPGRHPRSAWARSHPTVIRVLRKLRCSRWVAHIDGHRYDVSVSMTSALVLCPQCALFPLRISSHIDSARHETRNVRLVYDVTYLLRYPVEKVERTEHCFTRKSKITAQR